MTVNVNGIYVHVCERARWACSVGNNTIENLCIIIIQQVHWCGLGVRGCSGVCIMDRVMMDKCMALSVPLPLMTVKHVCFPLSFSVNILHTVSAPQPASYLYPQCDRRPKWSGFECSAEVPAVQQQTRPCQGGLFCVELISAFAFLCCGNNKCISDVPDASVMYSIALLHLQRTWLPLGYSITLLHSQCTLFCTSLPCYNVQYHIVTLTVYISTLLPHGYNVYYHTVSPAVHISTWWLQCTVSHSYVYSVQLYIITSWLQCTASHCYTPLLPRGYSALYHIVTGYSASYCSTV